MLSKVWPTACIAASGLVVATAAYAQMPPVLRDRPAPAFVKDGAKVLEASQGPGGMTVYTIEKNGKPLVLYTSPDGAVSFVGVMFDSKTGKNLSETIVARSQLLVAGSSKQTTPVVATQPAPPVAAAGVTPGANFPDGNHGPVAQHLFSSAVAGISEGKGAASSTTYVFFDPRCGYCHHLFQTTRDVAARGAAIKWIPVNTLGNQGIPMSAEVLRKGIASMPMLAVGNIRGVDATSEEQAMIQENTKLFGGIVRQVGLQAATPTIVFQGANGKLTLVQDDGSDKASFAAAFKPKS